MKSKIVLVLSTATLLMMGCKKEKDIENLEVVNQEVVEESFSVTLDFIMKKDDDIALYYTTDGSTDFGKTPPIWQAVKGSEVSQQLTFKLPAGVKPTEFRFDFGLKKDQGDVYFTKVTFKNKGLEKVISCPDMVQFFRANETYCTYDAATGLIKSKTINGVVQSPSIYPHEKNLLPELEKLF